MNSFHFQSPLFIVLLLWRIKGLNVLLFSGASNHFNVLINKLAIVFDFLSFSSQQAQLFRGLIDYARPFFKLHFRLDFRAAMKAPRSVAWRNV